LKQKSLRTQVNYSKIGIDKNQLSVNSRENSRTFPKIRGTALVTLNKVGGNPVSYSTANPRWKGVNVCLERETIDSVIPRIFLILSIGTAYGSDAALYAFSSISQQINLRID
jgi:hypothetical protein